MTRLLSPAAILLALSTFALSQDEPGNPQGDLALPAGNESADEKAEERRATGLTIHSENFALIRDRISLDVPPGGGSFSYDGATASLEPTSVILIPEKDGDLTIREQSYRNDVLSAAYLLSLFEGKSIEFMHESPDGTRTVFGGRVISSGYEGGRATRDPVFQINGKIRFGLPGVPLFPSLGDDTLLKPRLEWKIGSEAGYTGDATVSYLSGGMGWEASYNLVMPEDGGENRLDGLVSIKNHTGRDFRRAEIKLLAGEVNRETAKRIKRGYQQDAEMMMAAGGAPAVTHKSFDDYHMYSLPGEVRLRDQETKQVEFLSSSEVRVETIYKLTIQPGPGLDTGEGVEGKVEVVRKLSNTEDNGLGNPMPAGTFRVYRMDGESPEFLGEERISHTPAKEDLEITTGAAFDITAKKFRTERQDLGRNFMGVRRVVEGYKITVTNRKKAPVTVRVSEPMAVSSNWSIAEESHPHSRVGAGEARWDIEVPADGETTLSYKVEQSYP